jgi:hypothetical protein
VEDYSVNVISWLMLDPKSGTVASGESIQAEVTFDATGMEVGEYLAEFSISSDDPDLPEVIVPVSLQVSEYAVVASADPEGVCDGGSVQLHVEVFGGLGSYAYSWTSDPAGFTSTFQSPQVIPEVNTIYYVEAVDGTNTGSGQISVSVYELPEVTLGADTTVCEGEEVIFDAGIGFKTYEWQDGSSEQTFIATENGIYWVEVTNDFDCASRDSVVLLIHPLALQPAKPAGPGMVDLYEGNISDYITSELPDALYYLWELDPANAGEVFNSGFDVSIKWDTTYVGQAWLKVMVTNICGDSPWSDSLEIMIVNTFGIGELEQELGLEIYPNPSSGTFTIEFNSMKEMYVNIHVMNSLSAVVFQSENIHLTGHYTNRIDLGHLAEGMYTITVENERGRLSRQLIIRK